jgi:hypothetical protein
MFEVYKIQRFGWMAPVLTAVQQGKALNIPEDISPLDLAVEIYHECLMIRAKKDSDAG